MSENSKMTRRRFLEATGGAASAAAVGGLGAAQNQSEGNQNGGGKSAKTLNLINSTITTFDPVKATDTASGEVIQQVFDALTNYPNGNVAVKNLLAKSHSVSDDSRTYTFQLKQGVKFHNGEELTANDFVYAWERLAASDNSRRSSFILDSIGVKHKTDAKGNYQPNSLAVEAPNKYTLKMTLNEPFHATLEMLAYTSFAAVPEGIVGDIEGYDGRLDYAEFAQSNPVGCGPFQLQKWESNTEATVTAFDNYHGPGPKVGGINWAIISDANAIYNYAMNKNADAFNVPTSQYDPGKVSVQNTDERGRESGTYGPVRNGETLNFLSVPTINTYYMGFNTAQVPKPVRKAAAYAMNQQTLTEQVFKGRGVPAYHFTAPNIYPGGQDAYTKHAKQNYPYGYNTTQLDKARQVMKDAGYGQNNRASFTFTVYQSSNTWPQVGKLLRDKLSSAYIDMQVENAPFSTLLKRGRNGNLEAYSLGWVTDWPAPDNFLQLLNPPQTDTSKSSPISYVNWSGTDASKQAKQAWNKIQNNTAPTDKAEQKRNQAYIKMEEANWEDVVFLNTYHEADQRFWYDWADIQKFGAAGPSRQMFNQATLSKRN